MVQCRYDPARLATIKMEKKQYTVLVIEDNDGDFLLVEDNEGDILLTSDALEDCRIVNEVTIMRDGESAINFFKNLKGKDDRPDLILMDINLPKKSGIEVLMFLVIGR